MVRAHQDRLARRNVGQQKVNHDVARILVEPVGGLVEDQDIRVHRHYCGQRHALFLPARELIRRGIDQVGNLEQLHGIVHAALELARRQTHLSGTKGDFLAHRGAEQLGIGVLEHKANALMKALCGHGILQKRRVDHVSVKQVRAGVRELKAIDKAHDRRLAAAVGAEQGNQLAAIDLQRYAVDNRMPRIGEHHVA